MQTLQLIAGSLLGAEIVLKLTLWFVVSCLSIMFVCLFRSERIPLNLGTKPRDQFDVSDRECPKGSLW